jgi:hypothetical protein
LLYLFVKKVMEGREGREKDLRRKVLAKKTLIFYFYNSEGRFQSTISRRVNSLINKKMSDVTVSWIGLALSALLVIDKLLSKSKKVKCKCCGSEFEASESLSTPMTPKATGQTNIEIQAVKTVNIKQEPVDNEEVNKKD